MFFRRIPCRNEAGSIVAPIVKAETAFAQRSAFVCSTAHEQFVRFHCMHQSLFASSGDFLSRSIGMARIGQPDIAVQHGVKLRGKKPALGLQVPGTLAAVTGHIGKSGVKEHDCLGTETAVLDESEAQCIDIACCVSRSGFQKGNGIGKTGAIHMDGESALTRQRHAEITSGLAASRAAAAPSGAGS